MVYNLFIYSFLILFSFGNNCEEINQLRKDFHQINSEEKLLAFIDTYKSSTCKNSKPYLISATMRKAEYTHLPTKKYSYFDNGKKALEKYIQENPNDIEGRYIRVLVQSKLPEFLGYNSNLKTDISYINKNIEKANLPQKYKSAILEIIKSIK